MTARMPGEQEKQRMLAELAAIDRPARLAWLADLPAERRDAFRRILPPADREKLDAVVLAKAKQARQPGPNAWLEEARAGRATSPDAMIEVLLEIRGRLRPNDAVWIDRIRQSTAGRGYSRKQAAVLAGIYERYYGSATGD
jgi:DNA-binding TFAR19-related protein (PDSD5 family)